MAEALEFDRARDLLVEVARDITAPPHVRSEAYATLMRVMAQRPEWEENREDARQHWQEWQQLVFQTLGENDWRLSAWQVRVVRRPQFA